MKRGIITLLLVSGLIFSCSSDNDGDPQGEAAIVGTWQATELKINNETASDEAKFGRDILNHLTAKQCYILSLTFNADLSVVSESSANYLEINATSSGLDVPCPTQVDTESSTYTYDGKVLTYVDSDLNSTNINVTITGNTMSVDAAGLDIPNFNASGELIFERK